MPQENFDVIKLSKSIYNSNDVFPFGFYHLKIESEPAPVLVYFYYNEDAGCSGFGYNIADGGGFQPLYDVRQDTKIIPVEIKELKS